MGDISYALPEYITGEDIRTLRKRLHLTQKELAALLRVAKQTVVHWENSDARITGPAVLAVKVLREMPDYCSKLVIPRQEFPLRLSYYYRNELCTTIDVSDRTMEVRIRNYTRNVQNCAFGINTEPTYEDYQEFLKSRCFPQTRDKAKLELKELGLPFYDPLMIIEKTNGRVAEDDFWVKVERKA
ncbi:MAG: helix-turn-helix domain-containing protein [Eubacterium sp.]|nr:helix-turn-helix domain-containing protein [Eubacterium sp.]